MSETDYPAEWYCPISHELMHDPVIGPDGHTYERTAITQWLTEHGVSPMTRQPMELNQLVPNIALRNLIHSAIPNLSNTRTDIKTPSEAEQTHPPVNLICIIDKSASMDGVITTRGFEQDGFTRLDLVKHTMRTLITSLGAKDTLGIVSFSTTATLDITPTKMSAVERQHALNQLDDMESVCSTNLWDGIRVGLDASQFIIEESDKPVDLVVFTDGEANINPPRGIQATLATYISTNCNDKNIRIHTFGYGYSLNSKVLLDISQAHNGMNGFIPDCTMIGTVFINFLASLFARCFETDRMNVPVVPEDAYARLCSTLTEPTAEKIAQLANYLHDYTPQNEEEAEWIKAVLIDLEGTEDDNGQIGKAVSKPEWFARWGKHYLSSILSAHSLRICANFKDAALQLYQSPEFLQHQSVIEQRFICLPPPKPSRRESPLRGFHRFRNVSSGSNSVPVAPGGASIAINTASTSDDSRFCAPPPQPISMQSYYDATAGCFTPDTLIQVPEQQLNSSYKLVRIDQLSIGDKVITGTGQVSNISFIIKSAVSNPLICRPSIHVGLTLYHPIMLQNKWCFPKEIFNSTVEHSVRYVYNLVVANGDSVLAGGYRCITLAHGIENDPVASHAFFGTQAVIKSLKAMDTTGSRYVTVENLKAIRDPSNNTVTRWI